MLDRKHLQRKSIEKSAWANGANCVKTNQSIYQLDILKCKSIGYDSLLEPASSRHWIVVFGTNPSCFNHSVWCAIWWWVGNALCYLKAKLLCMCSITWGTKYLQSTKDHIQHLAKYSHKYLTFNIFTCSSFLQCSYLFDIFILSVENQAVKGWNFSSDRCDQSCVYFRKLRSVNHTCK